MQLKIVFYIQTDGASDYWSHFPIEWGKYVNTRMCSMSSANNWIWVMIQGNALVYGVLEI